MEHRMKHPGKVRLRPPHYRRHFRNADTAVQIFAHILEKFPEIQGVVIVAEGAGNAAVKLEIIRAVQALLEVPNEKIEVFKRS